MKDLDFKNTESILFEINFKGILDGNNYTLKNIIIKDNASDSGIFLETSSAIVKNIKFDNIQAINPTFCKGFLTPTAYNTEFHNIKIKNSIMIGQTYVAGIAGDINYCSLVDIDFDDLELTGDYGFAAVAGRAKNSVLCNISLNNIRLLRKLNSLQLKIINTANK